MSHMSLTTHLLHGVPLMSVPGLPSQLIILCASLINPQSDTLTAMILE